MTDDYRISRRECIKVSGAAAVSLGVCMSTHSNASQGAKGRRDVLPFEEYSQYDGLGLAALVRKGDITPSHLLESAIARADAIDSKIKAIVIRMYDRARKQVERGLPDGPFTGVPFLVKDLLFFMKGELATSGSNLWRNAKAPYDQTIVRRLQNAGLVIFGRTHSPEIGLLPTTESSLYGITRNPWDPDRTAGGSSGGTAAAVAAGIVPMGSASDGGGSIRIPASCCGLFGLKPTRGRVPWGPMFYELCEGLVVQHAITRTVRDSAALLDACDGGDLGDPYAAPAKKRPYLEAVKKPLGKLKMAAVTSVLPNVEADGQCINALEEAKTICRSLKHQVDDVTNAFVQMFPLPELIQAFRTIFTVHMALAIERRLAELGRDLRDGDVEPTTASLFHEAKSYTGADIVRARMLMHASSRIMAKFQRQYDIVLTPTLASPPIKHGIISLSRPGFRWPDELLEFQPSLPIANWTGQPAMSVPLYWTQDDLPIGVHFLGRYGDEDTLFGLASQLEREKPWFDKRPRLL